MLSRNVFLFYFSYVYPLGRLCLLRHWELVLSLNLLAFTSLCCSRYGVCYWRRFVSYTIYAISTEVVSAFNFFLYHTGYRKCEIFDKYLPCFFYCFCKFRKSCLFYMVCLWIYINACVSSFVFWNLLRLVQLLSASCTSYAIPMRDVFFIWYVLMMFLLLFL